MTRRAHMGPLSTLARGVDRMAPGGRKSASESPVRPFWRPIGETGEPAAPEPGPVSVLLRPTVVALDPASTPPLTLSGGAGNNTLRDQSDSSYARMAWDGDGVANGATTGAVLATFQTASIGWEPTQATLTCRGRALANTVTDARGTLGWRFTNPADIAVYAYSIGFNPESRWIPGSGWADMPSDLWWPVGGSVPYRRSLPTAADVAAGMKLHIYPAGPYGFTGSLQLDVADVWLLLEGVA